MIEADLERRAAKRLGRAWRKHVAWLERVVSGDVADATNRDRLDAGHQVGKALGRWLDTVQAVVEHRVTFRGLDPRGMTDSATADAIDAARATLEARIRDAASLPPVAARATVDTPPPGPAQPAQEHGATAGPPPGVEHA